VTEAHGHVIDPDGEARRALHAAVAEHGPEALSNAVIMDGICQNRLSDLPGEAILIGGAARSDVPALLRERIAEQGNYGAIQSVAATLAEVHGLDTAASLWVVREFARALGLIASGGTQPTVRIGPDGGTGAGAAPADEGASVGSGPTAAAGGSGSPGDEADAGGGSAGTSAGAEAEGTGAVPAGAGAAEAAGAGDAATGAGGPGVPAGMAAGAGGRPPSGSRVLSRNTVGVAAAIALVAGYLGVAAVAHLSPFPAQTVAATSPPPASGGNGASASPDESPDPAPDTTPPSYYQILLAKVPDDIKGADNCHNIGTSAGATAVSQCMAPQGLPAGTIIYYLYPSRAALTDGFGTFLTAVKFRRQTGCTTNGEFVDFTAECESAFTSRSPSMTGSIAEYANKDNNPIIATTDNQQNVMVVLVGTNDGDLLAYWKQLRWVAT
jgi:hypothetical protein